MSSLQDCEDHYHYDYLDGSLDSSETSSDRTFELLRSEIRHFPFADRNLFYLNRD